MYANEERREPSTGARRPVVVVLSEQTLTSDAVAMGLRSCAIDAYRGSLHEEDAGRATTALDVGLLLVEGDRPDLLDAMSTSTLATPASWIVLVDRPIGSRRLTSLAPRPTLVLAPSSTLEETAAAVFAMAAGRPVAGDEGAETAGIAPDPSEPSADEPLIRAIGALTRTERDVLEMLYRGKSVVEIAETRGTTVPTARHQVRSILRLLGVSSQLAAVALYARVRGSGRLPPPPEAVADKPWNRSATGRWRRPARA